MAKFYLEPLDAKGKRIYKGRRVRIVGIPDLSDIRDAKGRRETEAVFRHVRGRCMKVQGFNRYGFVELFFRIRAGRHSGWHGISIEPSLVLSQKIARSR